MLRKSLNMISQWIWLDVSGGGGFFTLQGGVIMTSMLTCKEMQKKILKKLYFAFLKKNVSRICKPLSTANKRTNSAAKCLLKSKGG